MKRSIVSTMVLLSFLVLCITGVLSYFTEYTRRIASTHTIFGFMFLVLVAAHMFNNRRALRSYLKTWQLVPMIILVSLMAFVTFSESSWTKTLMDYGARSKARYGQETVADNITVLQFSDQKKHRLEFELRRAEHFWHPQIAIWTEDSLGNYLETLFVTTATAKGIFAGGRTKDNFKTLDGAEPNQESGFRRVDALPVWSHKRGVLDQDGLYAPSSENPLPDAITGATPLDNFRVQTTVDEGSEFVVKLEINVAFDDNEYYSEFDFPDDSTFHNGTGQLGQPSIVFRATIRDHLKKSYQLMQLEGHGHHSGMNGNIYPDLSRLTTALQVVEYIIVGYKKNV